ncbi:MAG: hypothetical protein OXG99_18440 [Alphaproteobacteria bacterium]|nr:hypothetical protein [Alphaproteobacteria bacterium]
MADRPPETALDRLRAGLTRRDGSQPPADDPAHEPSPGPSQPVAAAPLDDPAPATEPAGQSDPTPRLREAPPVHTETVDEMVQRYELFRTRRRINLTWTAAVTLMAAVIAAAVYLPAFPMQDAWFRSVWPWRAHVWNRYGSYVIWCINEARTAKEPVVCQILFERDGPDCPRPDTGDVTAAWLCPPWETWPTDPAPRWSADGPLQLRR